MRRPLVEIVAVGCSTGGPDVLAELLPRLPQTLAVPVVIVQHMPSGFIAPLADRLDAVAPLSVVEAYDGAPLRAGEVLIAPGDAHMIIEPNWGYGDAEQFESCRVTLLPERDGADQHPSVDVLFASIARTLGPGALAVVLTGMGDDGVLGCEQIVRAGGRILTQDEASSIVWGMPGSVHAAGLSDDSLPPAILADEIRRRVGLGRLASGVHAGPRGRLDESNASNASNAPNAPNASNASAARRSRRRR